MSILSTREWATLIWGCILMLHVLCHREIRKSLWNVIVIFFDKKLRILWEIILLYVLTITIVFCYLPIWENIYIKDIIIEILFICICTLELFERIERFARIERTSGTVVSNEEPESERTGSESGTISGRACSTTSSLRRCFQ